MVATKTCVSEKFSLKIRFPVETHHGVQENRKLIEPLNCKTGRYLLIKRVYEDNKTQPFALRQGFTSITKKRKSPWQYGTELYKRCNEVERFFPFVLSGFAKFFTRYYLFSFITLTFDTLFM